MLFHTQVDISQNKALTPEGFLICKDVIIARTGPQLYFKGEVPVTADATGMVSIERNPEDVFDAQAIASFEGKPITMHHPEDLDGVTPDNWSELSKGHAQNVRQGTGIEQDVLKADFIIMEKSTIDAVMSGEIREVSCGYNADYVELGVGKGKQMNIRGNHIALVDRGRCGSLCAVKDSKPKVEKGGNMKGLWKKMVSSLTSDEQKEMGIKVEDSLTIDQRVDKLQNTVDKLVKMIKDAAEEAEKEKTEDEEAEEEKKKVADKKAKDAAFEGKETKEEEEAEKKTEDEEAEEEEKKTKDSLPIMQEVLYRASILAPSLSMPTMDEAKKMSRKTIDAQACKIKRRALDAAFDTEKGKAAISPFWSKPSAEFFTADCAAIDMAFIGASTVLKATSKTEDRASHKGGTFDKMIKGGLSVADLNKQNADFWQKRGGK
jgi:hypothetical protein